MWGANWGENFDIEPERNHFPILPISFQGTDYPSDKLILHPSGLRDPRNARRHMTSRDVQKSPKNFQWHHCPPKWQEKRQDTTDTPFQSISNGLPMFVPVIILDGIIWDLPLAWGSRSRQKDLASKKTVWSLRKSQLGLAMWAPHVQPRFFRRLMAFCGHWPLVEGWKRQRCLNLRTANSQPASPDCRTIPTPPWSMQHICDSTEPPSQSEALRQSQTGRSRLSLKVE